MSFCILKGRSRIIINPVVSRHLPIIHLFSRLIELRRRLLITDLKLSQKDILCEGIGIGDRSTWASPLVVAKLVIDRDLTLDLGRKILEVVVESHDGARIHVIAHRGTGVELFIHHNRLKVLERPIRYKILPEDIPCPPLNARGSVTAALGHVRTGSLSRGADSGLIGSIMP